MLIVSVRSSTSFLRAVADRHVSVDRERWCNPRVREEMRRIYQSAEVPRYLDEQATQLLIEGRQNFTRLGLLESPYCETASGIYLFPWTGDKIINTLVAMFNFLDAPATASGLTVFIEGAKRRLDLNCLWNNSWPVPSTA